MGRNEQLLTSLGHHASKYAGREAEAIVCVDDSLRTLAAQPDAADIWTSTSISRLKSLWNALSTGGQRGVVAFDELNCVEFFGETVALLESFAGANGGTSPVRV